MSASSSKHNLAFFWGGLALVTLLEWGGSSALAWVWSLAFPASLGGLESGRYIASSLVRGAECLGLLFLARRLAPTLNPTLDRVRLSRSVMWGTIMVTGGLVVVRLWQEIAPCPAARSALKSLAWGCLALAGPALEEIMFRGGLYALLRAEMGVALGALVSAVLFAAAHPAPAGVIGLAPAFVGAVAMALLYERWRCLGLCIGLHSLYNLGCLIFAAVGR
jgi:membrane protease YdiL (CAAX protease family)